ncbi:MAG: hypothetical protein H7145_01975 [Akkermansiaceae bacterium]|nr:hypothetical protein [Armatimonadota bacterium]
MNKRSCAAVSLTILTPALLAGCSRDCDPKKEPDCRPNGRGGYYRPYWGFGGGGRSYSTGGGSRSGTGVSGTSGRGGFGSFGGGSGRAGG